MTQATVIGQDGVRTDVEEVNVPDADHGEQYRQVAVEISAAKVAIHGMGAAKHVTKPVHADFKRDGQADRRPHRVSATDPVPQLQAAFGWDAPVGHLVSVGRDTDEMSAEQDFVLGAARLTQPLQRSVRVGKRVDGGERFRGNDK